MIMEEIRFDTKIPKVAVQELTEHFEGLQVILGEVVQMMEELVTLMTPQAEGPFDSLIGGADAFNSLADGRRNLEEIFGLLNKGLESAGGSFRDLDIFQALLSQTDTFATTFNTKVMNVVGAFNGISVEVPDWDIFGDLAGKVFGFQLAPVKLPRIPQLARGAVLPANRPFLAMVGDQRHGTNVEAPLATIQEAVALVMGDQISAMMAGFREVLREQQALRAAVEGIEVGDEVIGRAAARYGERMAVVRGGA